MGTKSRRIFLKLAIASMVSLLFILWNKLTLTHLSLKEKKVNVFPFNKKKLVAFFNRFIVINQNEKTTVLSAHCTHLGCTINKFENGKLICPCHGSEYDLEGNSVKGPAYKNLEKIAAEITDNGTNIKIRG